MLTHLGWSDVPGLRHGFLDRAECAGVPLPLDVPRQVHGIRVLEASGERPEADGFLATAPGRVVGVVTADCVPVLLVARGTRLAAAVHAAEVVSSVLATNASRTSPPTS